HYILAAAVMGPLSCPANAFEVKYFEWGTPGNTGPDLDLQAPTSDWTCFLTGIRGSLKGQSASPYSPVASVGVYDRAGKWKLEPRAGTGTGVSGRATCVRTKTASFGSLTWEECTNFPSNCASPTTTWTEGSRCFLASVWSRAGLTFHNGGDQKPGFHVT